MADCIDNKCPLDPNRMEPGVCSCGTPHIDSDGDEMLDCKDQCKDDPKKTAPGLCGYGAADTDSDGDSVPDVMIT